MGRAVWDLGNLYEQHKQIGTQQTRCCCKHRYSTIGQYVESYVQTARNLLIMQLYFIRFVLKIHYSLLKCILFNLFFCIDDIIMRIIITLPPGLSDFNPYHCLNVIINLTSSIGPQADNNLPLELPKCTMFI